MENEFNLYVFLFVDNRCAIQMSCGATVTFSSLLSNPSNAVSVAAACSAGCTPTTEDSEADAASANDDTVRPLMLMTAQCENGSRYSTRWFAPRRSRDSLTLIAFKSVISAVISASACHRWRQGLPPRVHPAELA